MRFFYRLCLLFLVAFSSLQISIAQYGQQPIAITTSIEPPVKVAVFVPLYLDEAFSGSEYKLSKTSLPKNILPGLEFYNGVMLAIDSLNMNGVNAEIKIYDLKQDAFTLDRILKGPEMADIGLIIAAVTSPAELKLLGAQAKSRNIPFISATYPNYVGISQNPNFILLNSSFNTHIEGLYKYMQRNHSLDQIIALKKPGASEDYIKNTINDLNKSTPSLPVKIKWIEVKDDVSARDILPHLDSMKNNVVFVASPLENFGIRVVKQLGSATSYRVTAIGMPTWDAIRDFNRRENANVDIIYSTPFNYSRNQDLNTSITKFYRGKFYSRPSDMVFKGYEATYHFTRLLHKHRDSLLFNLSDDAFTTFNNFDIKPVKLRKTNPQPDFMENKKLYFVRKREGLVLGIY